MSLQKECPVCGTKRDFSEKPIVGERVVCLDCGLQLQVTSVDPLRVDEAPHQGESWGE